MAYTQGGDVRGGRSPWSMSFIWDTCSELLNFVVSFVKTTFSLDAHENYGRVQDNGRPRGPAGAVGGVGRAPVSAAPVANNVHSLFASIATAVIGDHGNVHVIYSAEEWQTKVNEAKATRKVIVVDFFATWCGPCKMMAPVFVELSKKIGHQLVFVKMDVDEVSDVAAEYDVRAMPTFLFIKDGQQIDKVVGTDKNELERKCNQYATSR